MLDLGLSRLTYDFLWEIDSRVILIVSKWFYSTEYSHVTFQGYQLLLLNLPDLLILQHVRFHIFEASSVFLNFLFESFVFIFDVLEVLLLFLKLLHCFLYVSWILARNWCRNFIENVSLCGLKFWQKNLCVGSIKESLDRMFINLTVGSCLVQRHPLLDYCGYVIDVHF